MLGTQIVDYSEVVTELEDRLQLARSHLIGGRGMAAMRTLEGAAESLEGRFQEMERNEHMKGRVARLGAVAERVARLAGSGDLEGALKILDDELDQEEDSE